MEPVRYVQPTLRQALALANALEVRNMYNGQGVAIAIVDSGVDYRHPRLGGTGQVNPAGQFPNTKVIGGYDFGDNDPDPLPSQAAAPAGIGAQTAHGTACAGIAAGNLGTVGDYVGGVAYNAKIYAVKIAADANPAQWASDAALRAWDWCITHRNDDPQHPLLVISNSWGLAVRGFQRSATWRTPTRRR